MTEEYVDPQPDASADGAPHETGAPGVNSASAANDAPDVDGASGAARDEAPSGNGAAGANGTPSAADTAFETFAASWVPPWARDVPELQIEPAAEYPPQELNVGRFAYGDSDDLPDPEEFQADLGDEQLRGALEAILLVVDNPVSTTVLAQVLEEPASRVEAMLTRMREEYARPGRGIDLRHVAGGWRFYTRSEYASYVERFVLDGQQIRLTQAALETLAVVAYKQPVTRSKVSAIRGVNCDGVMKTLVTRGLIEECGTEESGAHLYRTTQLFLEKLGINSVEELPSLAQYLPNDLDEVEVG